MGFHSVSYVSFLSVLELAQDSSAHDKGVVAVFLLSDFIESVWKKDLFVKWF